MPTTFAQTIDGNYIYAQRAVQDKNGDDIDQTYAKSASLATVATSGAYSDLSGTPTIPSGTQLVPTATIADADKVLTVDAQGTPGWASAQAPITAGAGIDITNNVVSVDTSVVATQTDLAGKEDVFDVGTGLEMDTSGSTPTLQVEAPVDIVAGPGIVIDNPDGNTLRVSVAQAEEVTLYENSTGTDAPNLSENVFNFARVRVTYMGGAAIKGEVECDISSSIAAYNLTYPYFRPDSIFFVQFQCSTMTVSNNGSTLTFTDGKRLWIAPTSSNTNGNDVQPIKCTKVVGIHRIASN